MSSIGVNKAIFDGYVGYINIAKEAFRDTCMANGCQSFDNCHMCNKMDFFSIRLERKVIKDLINNK